MLFWLDIKYERFSLGSGKLYGSHVLPNKSSNFVLFDANFLYTLTLVKGRLNVPTALGHMLMPSAQR